MDTGSEKPQVMSGGNSRRDARTEAANERASKMPTETPNSKTKLFEKDALGKAGDTVLENQDKARAEEQRQKDINNLADKITSGNYR